MTTQHTDDALNLARWCLERQATDPATAGRLALTFAHSYDDSMLDETWTYAALWDRVAAIGRGLLAQGLRPGERVVIRLPHAPQYALAFFGATVAGLLPVPASPQLTPAEVAFVLADAEARAVICSPADRPAGFDGIVIDAAALSTLDGDAVLPQTHAEDAAYLIYTSGTTARPKGVLHAHRSVRGRALMRDAWQGLRADDVLLHAGALNWSYTMGVGLMDPWAAGAHAVLFDGVYEAAGWPRLMERLGVTIFAAVPTVYRQMLKYARPEDADLHMLRHGLCAGEALPPAVYDEWLTRIGTPLYESLGMTEVSTYISAGPAVTPRPGSPGRPQPGRRVAVLPEAGGTDPLPPGEEGLLAVHRTDPGLMLGYWRRPAEEAAVLRGDWFVGGDVGTLDADGYFWFRGRADDVIKAFGYRLSPVEIEAALASCAGVADVGVVAMHIDDAKTLVTACVVREPNAAGSALDAAMLERHAADRLAEYKRPHQYRFVDALPRTRNGKLQRNVLVSTLEASV